MLKSVNKKIDECNDISDIKKKELKYGMACLCSFLEKFLALLVLNLIFGSFKNFILIILFFAPLRIFGFGFHAKNNYQCWIISLMLYLVIPALVKIIVIPNHTIDLVAILSTIIIGFFAPAETTKKPLKNKQKNKKRKIISILICLLYFTIIKFTNNYSLKTCILAALVLEALLVSPVLYKLFNLNRTLPNSIGKV